MAASLATSKSADSFHKSFKLPAKPWALTWTLTTSYTAGANEHEKPRGPVSRTTCTTLDLPNVALGSQQNQGNSFEYPISPKNLDAHSRLYPDADVFDERLLTTQWNALHESYKINIVLHLSKKEHTSVSPMLSVMPQT